MHSSKTGEEGEREGEREHEHSNQRDAQMNPWEEDEEETPN